MPKFKQIPGRTPFSFPQIHYKKSRSLELSRVFLVFFGQEFFIPKIRPKNRIVVCEVGEGRVSVSGLEMERHRRDMKR